MKRVIIIAAIFIIIVFAGLIISAYIKTNEEQYIVQLEENIRTYLNEEDYVGLFNLYNSADDKYYYLFDENIETYIERLCEDSINNLDLNRITKFNEANGNYPNISQTIKYIETRLSILEESARDYTEALAAFDSRDFDHAKRLFELVIEEDPNHHNAQLYLEQLQQREDSWSNNISGRAGFANSCAYDGEYLYVPFVQDGIDGIYKIDGNGKTTNFFPLSDQPSVLYITGINVVGDYLYFIAGEKVGSGYTFDSPYCIYEMKTDGSGLTLVLEGNFTDLYIKGTRIYALSREYGLIEYDKNFENLKVIDSRNIVELTFDNELIYYTVQGDLTHNSINTVYVYNGEQPIEVDSEEYLHYYHFDDSYVKYWKWRGSNVTELLYYVKGDDEIKLENEDMSKVYGIVDNKVFYSYIGLYGEDVYKVFDINTNKKHKIEITEKISQDEFVGIWYENDRILIERNGQLYIGDVLFENLQQINQFEISDDILANNSKAIKHITDEEIYCNESGQELINIIEDKQIWHYKTENLHIDLEMKYIDKYDSNVYITHIFTNDYKLFTTGNGRPESLSSPAMFKANYISDIYGAVYAQSTDAFYYGINTGLGIIVRQGQLVRDILAADMIAYFADGTMEVYRSGDDIDGERLIQKGALFASSFGPVLVEDYDVIDACAGVYRYQRNPRSAIGYVEPGHYVMIACDGRDFDVSRGLHMIQLAQIFEDEGCSLAYNLDGGATTTVLFMGNYITRRDGVRPGLPDKHRLIAEIFYIGSTSAENTSLDEYMCDYKYFSDNYK